MLVFSIWFSAFLNPVSYPWISQFLKATAFSSACQTCIYPTVWLVAPLALQQSNAYEIFCKAKTSHTDVQPYLYECVCMWAHVCALSLLCLLLSILSLLLYLFPEFYLSIRLPGSTEAHASAPPTQLQPLFLSNLEMTCGHFCLRSRRDTAAC